MNADPADRSTGNRRRPSTTILVLVTAIGPLALNIFVPSIPGLQRAFGAGYGTVQLVLSLYLVGVAVGQLFYGPLSDRHGRRPMLLAGVSLFVAGTVTCLAAPNIHVLIAGRVVQALGGCAGLVLSRAIIRDIYDRDQAAAMIALVTSVMVLAPMIAPTIGGLLDAAFGWRAGFVVVLGAGLAVLLMARSTLHETHHERATFAGPFEFAANSLRLLGDPGFLRHALQVTFSTSVFFSFLAGAPYVLIELMGRTAADYGLLFTLVSAMFITGNLLTRRLAGRLAMDRLIAIGTGTSLAATLVLGALHAVFGLAPLTLFGCMAMVALGNGLSLPNGMAGALSAAPRLVGTSSGLTGFLQMGIGAAMSYVTGRLLSDSALPLVLVMAACASLAAAVHWAGRGLARPRRS